MLLLFTTILWAVLIVRLREDTGLHVSQIMGCKSDDIKTLSWVVTEAWGETRVWQVDLVWCCHVMMSSCDLSSLMSNTNSWDFPRSFRNGLLEPQTQSQCQYITKNCESMMKKDECQQTVLWKYNGFSWTNRSFCFDSCRALLCPDSQTKRAVFIC